MSITRFCISLLLTVAIVAMERIPLGGQLGPGSPPPVPLELRGLALGERIPPLDLVDQSGRQQTLRTLTGPKGLVLLFVRSADW